MTDPDKIFGRLGNRMFQMAYIYSQFLEGNLPDIYLQDPAHFDKFSSKIKDIFREGIGMVMEVGVHMRRGDYITAHSHFYVDLSKTDYYERALREFPFQKRFIVFSDDMAFAKTFFTADRFPEREFLFSEGNGEVDDMNLMASCQHQITANSSFSWWAAYLNPNPSKTVVAPSVDNWYADKVERTKCPVSWIRI